MCRGPIAQVNNILRLAVGADLSRPAPIYRLSVDVPISELFCESSFSRPQGDVGLPRQFDPSPPPVDAINRVPTGLAESLIGYLANDLKFDARQFGFVCIADGMFTVWHFKICRHTTQFR